MTAFEYLKSLPFLPTVPMRGQGKEIYGRPSNAELKRWLENSSVTINGGKPKPNDEITFPLKELVFFSGKNTVSMWYKE